MFVSRNILPILNGLLKRPYVLSSKNGYRSYYLANKYNIGLITTNNEKLIGSVKQVIVATPHNTHFKFVDKCIKSKRDVWIPPVLFKWCESKKYSSCFKNA